MSDYDITLYWQGDDHMTVEVRRRYEDTPVRRLHGVETVAPAGFRRSWGPLQRHMSMDKAPAWLLGVLGG